MPITIQEKVKVVKNKSFRGETAEVIVIDDTDHMSLVRLTKSKIIRWFMNAELEVVS